MGWSEVLVEEEVLLLEVPHTLTNPKEQLRIPGVSENASPRILGMECCSTHSWVCSWVTEVGHMLFVATVPLAKQGTSMAARDAVGVEAGNPRKNSVARSVFLAPGCQILNGAISKVHTVEESRVGPTLVAYMDLDGVACQQEQPAEEMVVDVAVVVEEGLGGWMAADSLVSGKGSPSVVVQRLVGSPTAEAGRVGADVDEGNGGIQVERRRVASGFLSYLRQSELYSADGAEAEEEEQLVVGTCVCYYLSGPGHDARSRIGSTACVQFGASFRNMGCQGVVQRSDRMSGMWALPRVWRRERFIVKRAPCRRACTYLDRQQPDRRPSASFSYVDVRRRRSDSDNGHRERAGMCRLGDARSNVVSTGKQASRQTTCDNQA